MMNRFILYFNSSQILMLSNMFQHVKQNKKLVDESVGEAQLSDSQFTFSNKVFRSINLDFIQQNLRVQDDPKNTEAAAEIVEKYING
ncbi:hypothetical protein P3S67_000251 [Capsicum chacoense]